MSKKATVADVFGDVKGVHLVSRKRSQQVDWRLVYCIQYLQTGHSRMWSTRSAAAFSSSARALVPPDPSSSRRTLCLADCRFATNEEIKGQNIALIDEHLEIEVALGLFTIQQL